MKSEVSSLWRSLEMSGDGTPGSKNMTLIDFIGEFKPRQCSWIIA